MHVNHHKGSENITKYEPEEEAEDGKEHQGVLCSGHKYLSYSETHDSYAYLHKAYIKTNQPKL